MIIPRLLYRLIRTTRPRLLWRFVWDFALRGTLSVRRYQKRKARGSQFPPFIYISVTNECNLHCQGCWVSVDAPTVRVEAPELDRIIRQSRRRGVRFYGILGGEPLLHPDIPALFERHRDCYFQLFTNGTLMTDEVADRIAEAGNVTPLVSIEGDEVVSDIRRGEEDVFAQSMRGLRMCLERGIITGVATSVCKSNMNALVSEAFLDRLMDLGVHYVWYYAYRPSGPDPCPHLALDADEIVALRRFCVEMRCRKPLTIVETYHDADGGALCPAAEGMSYHINSWGDIEPCPPIQFAVENLRDDEDFVRQIETSQFIRDFREFCRDRTRGCVLLEEPEKLDEFLRAHCARDTTGRGTGYQELAAMCPRPSQHLVGREIPEKHWAYRFAKKHWFFGFGGYA